MLLLKVWKCIEYYVTENSLIQIILFKKKQQLINSSSHPHISCLLSHSLLLLSVRHRGCHLLALFTDRTSPLVAVALTSLNRLS